MAGLINQAQSEEVEQEEPMPEERPTPGGAQPVYKSKAIEAVPDNLKQAFEKIVLAGMKILYSPEMRDEIQKEMTRDVPVFKKLGEGIAKLMTLIDHSSGKKLPQVLIIPAGLELLAEAAEFFQKTGQIRKISPDEMRAAQIYFTICAAKIYGVKDADIQSLFKRGQSAQAAEPEEPAMPPEQVAVMGA